MGPGLAFLDDEKSNRYLRHVQGLVKFQQGRWPEDDRCARDATRREKQRAEAKQEPIQAGQIRGPPPRPIDHQQLLLHQQAVGYDGLGSARSKNPRDCRQPVGDKDQQVSGDGIG